MIKVKMLNGMVEVADSVECLRCGQLHYHDGKPNNQDADPNLWNSITEETQEGQSFICYGCEAKGTIRYMNHRSENYKEFYLTDFDKE